MKHTKGALELSANVIVIIVISIVILSSGLFLLSKLRQSTMSYVEGVDSSTEAQLRALMLNNNQKVSLYPTDITVERKKSATAGLGITNILNETRNFSIERPVSVMFYQTPESIPINYTQAWSANKSIITSYFNSTNASYYIGKNINPKDQFFKSVLIKVPPNSRSGLYVVTLEVKHPNLTAPPNHDCDRPFGIPTPPPRCITYDKVKLYVNVP